MEKLVLLKYLKIQLDLKMFENGRNNFEIRTFKLIARTLKFFAALSSMLKRSA